MRFTRIPQRLAALLLAVLLAAASAQAESYSAIVTSASVKVYADEACTWALGTLPRTTVVTVESIQNGVAKISRGDNTGYAAVSGIKPLEELATKVAFNTNSRVYQSASLGSRWLSVSKGMELNLLATNGRWAMVERDGVVAYTNRDHLSESAEKEPEASASTPVVMSVNSRVYQSPSLSSRWIAIPAGTEMNLLATNGGWAMVERGGTVAYTNRDHLSHRDSQPEQTETFVEETFSAVVTSGSMPVYESASTSSTYLGAVNQGVTVTVRAYSSAWAAIELNGRKGYAQIAHLTRAEDPSPSSYINNPNYTTEQIVYLFLTREMGLNQAVVCGILANIERESSFRVTAASYDGGYGLIQWTGGRNTRLKNWCADNDYDHAALEGQLWYLKYELETHYPKILAKLRSIENNPAGAYEAGHYFCYNFEIPANRAARSVERGNLAKDKYWAKYAAG